MDKLYRVSVEIEAKNLKDLALIFFAIVGNLMTCPPKTILKHQRLIIEERIKGVK